jgi:hypothetical protein
VTRPEQFLAIDGERNFKMMLPQRFRREIRDWEFPNERDP